jgi:hypothetical protein
MDTMWIDDLAKQTSVKLSIWLDTQDLCLRGGSHLGDGLTEVVKGLSIDQQQSLVVYASLRSGDSPMVVTASLGLPPVEPETWKITAAVIGLYWAIYWHESERA